MTRVLLSAPMVLSVLLAAGSGCAQSPEQPVPDQRATAAPAEYETTEVAVVLPKGEPRAGRQAFLDLKCTVCHRVPQDQEFPASVSRSQGPDLDHTLGLRPASEVAAAIIIPSHSMSLKTSDEVKKHLESVLSPMGDFSRVMTVRQLADLLAYLQSLETAR